MYSSYMYHLKVSVWIFYQLMNFHWDQKKLKYIWHYVHSWLQRSGIFVPLPLSWLWGICIYPCPGWLVGYLYKYVCECLPSPFPGRPQLISSIVQGSSKQASSTNPIYQSKVGGIQEYTRVEVQLIYGALYWGGTLPLYQVPRIPVHRILSPIGSAWS